MAVGCLVGQFCENIGFFGFIFVPGVSPPHEATEVGTVFKCFSSGKNSPEHLLFSRTVLHKADLGDLEKPLPSGKSKESFLLQK